MILASILASLLAALLAYWQALTPEMQLDAWLVVIGAALFALVLWINDARAPR